MNAKQKNNDLEPLYRGDSSEAVLKHKERLKRWVSRNFGDDELLGDTIKLTACAAWILGATESTVKKMISDGKIPVGVQRMIAEPDKRNAAQKQRADERKYGPPANGHGTGSGGLH